MQELVISKINNTRRILLVEDGNIVEKNDKNIF